MDFILKYIIQLTWPIFNDSYIQKGNEKRKKIKIKKNKEERSWEEIHHIFLVSWGEKNKERRNALEQTMIDVLSLPLGLSFFEPASHERNNTPGPNSTQHRTFPFSKAHVNVILSICVEKRTSTICHSPDHKVHL